VVFYVGDLVGLVLGLEESVVDMWGDFVSDSF
jgi:hypothetical protein